MPFGGALPPVQMRRDGRGFDLGHFDEGDKLMKPAASTDDPYANITMEEAKGSTKSF